MHGSLVGKRNDAPPIWSDRTINHGQELIYFRYRANQRDLRVKVRTETEDDLLGRPIYPATDGRKGRDRKIGRQVECPKLSAVAGIKINALADIRVIE